MSKTRHIQQRMSQRGIKEEMLELVERFGVWQGDKCIVNRKACSTILKEIDTLRKKVIKLQEKGGLVLVHDNGMDITTYPLDSYRRQH